MRNLPESRGCLLQLTLFFCDWQWLVSGVRRWHTCPTPRRRLVVSRSAMGSAASGGSSVAVGDAALMGPELPFDTWWHWAHRSLHSNKALDFPRPLAFVLSEFVNLMASWLCGCWGVGSWPALPLLSSGRLGVEVLLHSILQRIAIWGITGLLGSTMSYKGLWHEPLASLYQCDFWIPPLDHIRGSLHLTPNLCWVWLMTPISSWDLTFCILLANQLFPHYTWARVSFAFPWCVGEEDS